MVLREALALVAAGRAIGLPAALLPARRVPPRLFAVKPTDLETAAAALLILSLAAAAPVSFRRARRATSVPFRHLAVRG